jgi:hypothetical protein
MKYRRIYTLMMCSLLGASYVATAQDEIDAFRFSNTTVQGTARSMGFGNTLGSVGGDFSTLSVNPAGIGIYRSSEYMITPSVKINSVNSDYLGNSTDKTGSRFNFTNFGAIFTKSERGRRYDRSNWKSVSFGIGINRTADFTRNYIYEGINSGPHSSSGSEYFVQDANSDFSRVNSSGTPASLGYNSYLIDFDSATNRFYTNVPWQQGINQKRVVKERGGISEIVLSFGGNYKEKLMLGATIGIPSLRYTRDATYSEQVVTDTLSYFRSFRMDESLTTTGLGINLKLGFIYKPSDYFRIGAAFHTPTAFAMTDVYDQSVLADTKGYANNGTGDMRVIAPQNQFDYTLITPWKGVISATGMLGKIGFITADYEYVNYKSMRYNLASDYSSYESAVNQAIKNTYKAVSNFRAGVEFRIDPVMIRGGFGYYGNPYENTSMGSDRFDFSAGLGFRFEHTFIDFGFVHSQYKSQEQPYYINTAAPGYQDVVLPTAKLKNSLNTAAVTIGFKF